MIQASTKVTRSSAIAGVITAVLFLLQEVQTIEDLPTWALMAIGAVLTGLGTISTGYQTTEKNPSPSMVEAVRAKLNG